MVCRFVPTWAIWAFRHSRDSVILAKFIYTTALTFHLNDQHLWEGLSHGGAVWKALMTSRPRSCLGRGPTAHSTVYQYFWETGSCARRCRRGSQRSPSGWYCRTFSYPLHFRVLLSYSPQCSFLLEGCWVCENRWHLRQAVRCDFATSLEVLERETLGLLWNLVLGKA